MYHQLLETQNLFSKLYPLINHRLKGLKSHIYTNLELKMQENILIWNTLAVLRVSLNSTEVFIYVLESLDSCIVTFLLTQFISIKAPKDYILHALIFWVGIVEITPIFWFL